MMAAMSMSVRYPDTVPRMSRRVLVALLAAVTLASPSTAAVAKAPAPPQPRPVVIEYYDSGQWTRDVVKQTTKAKRLLRQGLKRVPENRKPAIVLDIDDTSLTQYPCRKPGDLPFDDPTVNASCIASGTLPPIAETRSVYRLAQRRGVRVFFITGRPVPAREVTVRNLREAGFTGRHELILRPTDQLGAPSAIPYKSAERRRIQSEGYRIVVNVGDQLSDLRGGHAMHRVKLPNPMYRIR
jgi:acid phosphatase